MADQQPGLGLKTGMDMAGLEVGKGMAGLGKVGLVDMHPLGKVAVV